MKRFFAIELDDKERARLDLPKFIATKNRYHSASAAVNKEFNWLKYGDQLIRQLKQEGLDTYWADRLGTGSPENPIIQRVFPLGSSVPSSFSDIPEGRREVLRSRKNANAKHNKFVLEVARYRRDKGLDNT